MNYYAWKYLKYTPWNNIYMKYTWNTYTWSTWNAQIDNYYYYYYFNYYNYFIFMFYLLLLHYYLILIPYNNKYDSTLRLNYTQKTIFPMLFSDTIANHNRYQATKTLLKDSIAVPTPLEWNPDLMQGSRRTAIFFMEKDKTIVIGRGGS